MTSMEISARPRRRRWALAVGCGLAVALAGISVTGAAAAGAPAPTYTGCLSKPLKIIYNVAVNQVAVQHCAGQDTAISWSQTGPVGPAGAAAGDTGPAGAMGPPRAWPRRRACPAGRCP